MLAASITQAGPVRANNEDAVFYDVAKGLFMVADGMGGCSAGEVASRVALDAIVQVLSDCSCDSPEEKLREALYFANDSIKTMAKTREDYQGMGTTVTAAWYVNGLLYVAHVGDSRAYLWQGGSLQRLTSDHSFVGELVREGKITEEEAQNHPQKHMLTRALGSEVFVKVDVLTTQWHEGEALFMCTDGLSGLVPEEELAVAIDPRQNPGSVLKKLVNMAIDKGGFDNITAILAWQEKVQGGETL